MKRRLKKWVKVVITILVLVVSMIIYTKLGTIGQLAQASKFYEIISVLGWTWLVFGQVSVLSIVWEN